ncbi:hypothetical protein [Colwellia psychrerythraea]|uniref:Uncharacterized protein n=1 Tax=Colwellia psychrerythraea TaxID=28229 RepID=A0A099L6A2_COLPS|nr:hypothetical protein [Colwellia psychrerythraea]KGJ97642.1 hypothetical protein GAB14E_1231 [Colwellia psychrerythraea]
MDLLQKNPFTTLKANDLNDAEINEQWVDSQGGFADFFCPTHKVSQYILGGKGSGKTHLMRYFSYNSQMVRNSHSILEGIKNDGYFGIYFQASGLNGERFEGLPFAAKKKSALFEYSYELWCAGLIIQALIEINAIDPLLEDESAFCEEVLSLFFKKTDLFNQVNNLVSLQQLIKELSNKVDYEVNNAFFSDDTHFEVLTKRGSLIFGIPKLITAHIDSFAEITFLYLIDELENINPEQQKYINTLLREKQLPCSFRLGARGYGIKTFKTLGSNEENREGHEYEITKLDNILHDKSDYELFAINLIINRLEKSGFISKSQKHLDIFGDNIKAKKTFLNSLFEEPDLNSVLALKQPENEEKSSHMTAMKNRISSKRLPDKTAEIIVSYLSNRAAPLVEAASIHLFSQYWKDAARTPEELVSEAKKTKELAYKYIDSRSNNSLIHKKINYYKNNYLASSLRAKSQKNIEQYLGLENLLLVTKGFPRHILTALRNIYKNEVFAGNVPFSGSTPISIKSQKISLMEAANWFHNECSCEGVLGNRVLDALANICEILRIEMYADKPVECSASSFTVDESLVSDETRDILRWGVLIRVFIEAPDRQEKNSQKLISKFHINSLLCPKWGLSAKKRGAISFTPDTLDVICSKDRRKEFDALVNTFTSSRNMPFKVATDEDESKDTQQNGFGF